MRSWLTRSAVAAAALAIGLLSAAAQDDPNTITDPAKAGPDYAVQGEYAGTDAKTNTRYGAQVWAEGDGKFKVRLLTGGLPGAGWDLKTQRPGGAIRLEGKTTVNAKDYGGEIVDGKMTLRDGAGLDVSLSRVERKSDTLGKKPPDNAVVLFAGKSLDAWVSAKDGTSPAPWEITADESFRVTRKGGDLLTKAKFRDFTLHLEFMLPYMPKARGQGRANSGVYLQNRYELQILDSFGLKGANNEAGGLYQLADPIVNMCLPPLAWQTYDVTFTAARFEGGKKVKDAIASVYHNGTLVQDSVKFPKSGPGGADESDAPGPLRLQDHGNPVAFRNVWVVENK